MEASSYLRQGSPPGLRGLACLSQTSQRAASSLTPHTCRGPLPLLPGGHPHAPKSSRRQNQCRLKMSFYLSTKLKHNIYICTWRKKY